MLCYNGINNNKYHIICSMWVILKKSLQTTSLLKVTRKISNEIDFEFREPKNIGNLTRGVERKQRHGPEHQ